MKKLNKLSMVLMCALTMIISFGFISCTDENEEVTTPQFPELKEISGKAGDVLDVAFVANMDWTIESDAAWCKFVNGDFKEMTANGKAGNAALKVELSEENLNATTADVAQLTLKMADQSQVIFKVTRAAKELKDLVVTNEDGTIVYGSETPLVIKGSGLRDIPGDQVYTYIKASAENGAEIGVIDFPSWLNMTNEENGVFKLIFNKENVDGISPINSFGTDKEYKLVVAVKGHDQAESDKVRKVEIPLAYEGLKYDYVTISPLYDKPLVIDKDGWTISADGQLTDGSGGSTEGETEEFVMEWSQGDELFDIEVKDVRNGEFEVLVIEKTELDLGTGVTRPVYDFTKNVDWLKITKTETGFTFGKPDELSSADPRGAVVMVFSKDFMDKHRGDLAGVILDEDGYIKPEYATMNTFATFTQKGKSLSLKGFFQLNNTETLIPFGSENPEGVTDETLKIEILNAMCESQWDTVMSSFDLLLIEKGAVYLEIVNYVEGLNVTLPEDVTTDGASVKFEQVTIGDKQYVKITGTVSDCTKVTIPENYLTINSDDYSVYFNASIYINNNRYVGSEQPAKNQ